MHLIKTWVWFTPLASNGVKRDPRFYEPRHAEMHQTTLYEQNPLPPRPAPRPPIGLRVITHCHSGGFEATGGRVWSSFRRRMDTNISNEQNPLPRQKFVRRPPRGGADERSKPRHQPCTVERLYCEESTSLGTVKVGIHGPQNERAHPPGLAIVL